MKNLKTFALLIAFYSSFNFSPAQDIKLHVNPRWDECSFELSPTLTQSAWHQFTREAGLVAYFRPLTDAKPLGKMHFEISLLQWNTAIDDEDPAWNDTFVHPDSTHWLKDGPRLPFPGLTARLGISDKVDIALYWTKNPNANYGVWGGQLQYNLLNNSDKNWAASTRFNFTSIYGPEDLNLIVYGLDLIASKEFRVISKWASIAPYAGVSTFLSHSHETTLKVDLKDENVIGIQTMVGAVVKLSVARIGVEYNLGRVDTISFKVGINL